VLCRLLLALALAQPLAAIAWNSAGHRLIACIAWDRLADGERAAIAQLLRDHPDYARWQHRGDTPADGGTDPARKAFIEASTWPDEIRKDKRFYSAGVDAPTPTLPGFPDMERRRNWHGVSYPLAPDGADRGPASRTPPLSGRIDKALPEVARAFGARETPRIERVYALPWLIHLVGDAHQPLHTSARVDANGQPETRGATVIDPFNPRKRETTPHAYWDDLPGPPWLRGEKLDAACRELADAAAPPAASTPAQWLEESWQLARSVGYPPGDDVVPTISAEFDARAREIARRRISEAGQRLAGLLHELLGSANR
jgi:hypothetical protein